MKKMEDDTVSTGEAARLCSVKRDTILKWIKRKKIPSIRTAGGHFRIQGKHLTSYITKKEDSEVRSKDLVTTNSNLFESKIPCWEFNSINGKIIEGCKKCIVWKAKILKCYFIADKGDAIGHARLFCKNDCQKCNYYYYAVDSLKRVLIISEEITEAITKPSFGDNAIEIQITHSPYKASSLIESFRPNFIILDKSLTNCNTDEVFKEISNDPRAYHSSIILGIHREKQKEELTNCQTINMRNLVEELLEYLGKVEQKEERREKRIRNYELRIRKSQGR